MGMAQQGRKPGRFGDEPFGALIEVHQHRGPGLMQSAYEACGGAAYRTTPFTRCVEP
jgi:hypothetical protein